MSMLLEDLVEELAEETLAGNQRAVDRLDAEVARLKESIGKMAWTGVIRMQAADSVRHGTEYVLARLAPAEEVMRLALGALRQKPFGEDAERLLHLLVKVFESGQRLVHSVRALREIAEPLEVIPARFQELQRAEARFGELAAEARTALQHRSCEWQPADPERFAVGLHMAREGKTISAEDALARFRKTQS